MRGSVGRLGEDCGRRRCSCPQCFIAARWRGCIHTAEAMRTDDSRDPNRPGHPLPLGRENPGYLALLKALGRSVDHITRELTQLERQRKRK